MRWAKTNSQSHNLIACYKETFFSFEQYYKLRVSLAMYFLTKKEKNQLSTLIFVLLLLEILCWIQMNLLYNAKYFLKLILYI